MTKTKDTPVSGVKAKNGAAKVETASPARKRKAEPATDVDMDSSAKQVAAKKRKMEAAKSTPSKSGKKNTGMSGPAAGTPKVEPTKKSTPKGEPAKKSTPRAQSDSTALAKLPQSPGTPLEKKSAKKRARKNKPAAAGGQAADVEETPVKTRSEQPTALARLPEKAQAVDIDFDHSTKKPLGWSVSSRTAGRFINHDPIFVRDRSNNDEYLLASNGRELQLLSIETSLPVRACPASEGQSIRCFAVDSSVDAQNIVMAHADGTVAYWDWISDVRTSSPNHAEGRPEALAISNDGATFMLAQAGLRSVVYLGKDLLHSTKTPLQSIKVLGDEEYVVAYGPTAILLGKRNNDIEDGADPTFIWVTLPMPRGITCLDSLFVAGDGKRRSTLSLAVGDSEGQIHLYTDVTTLFLQKGQASLPSPRILHWHREAVSAVKFSKDGNYLVSGGKETVLVLWQLETGKKQFLPHLTSDIERIVVSPEGDKYAVQMGDNSIMVLSTSELKPVANFAGLQLAAPMDVTMSIPAGDHVVSEKRSVAAILHPANASHILLAVPATQPKSQSISTQACSFLQTFDLRTSRHVTRQALTRNNVTDFNLGPEKTPIVPPDVTRMKISSDGQWLATIDEWTPPSSDLQHLVRDDGEQLNEEVLKRKETYLKIWRWDAEQALWTLSTRIDVPHARSDKAAQSAGQVFELLADPSPASAGFATIGEDSCVKLWKPRTRTRHGVAVKGQDDTEVIEWVCRRTIELPRQSARVDSPVEDDTATAETPAQASSALLAWSEDGSTLAATQLFAGTSEQPLIHFIDSVTGNVKVSRSDLMPLPQRLESMAFLDRYFLAVSRGGVAVWDLVTSSLLHQHAIPSLGAATLVVNSFEGTFAVAVGAKFTVFDPKKTGAVFMTECKDDIVGVLAGKNTTGFTLLFGDATVRTVASTATSSAFVASLATTDDHPQLAIEAATQPAANTADADVDMSEAVLALPSSVATQVQELPFSDLALGSAEDDRPVVRPEDLAKVFDVAQSFAMPPVREMFEAVMGLYGRRPLATALGVPA